MKNIIVVSHRRSGTHLTIDSISNNFKAYKKADYVNIDQTNSRHNKKISIKKFDEKILKNIRIIKSHYLPSFDAYYKNTTDIDYVKQLFENSNIIYVYRNGLDVMVSLFEYMRAYDKNIDKLKFDEFLETKNNFDPQISNLDRIESWKYHVKAWKESEFANKIVFVKFEDLINNYTKTIFNISEQLNIKANEKIIDIRLKQSNNLFRPFYTFAKKIKGIKKTSVSARKGRVGEHKVYFDNKTLKNFMDKNKDFLKLLGY